MAAARGRKKKAQVWWDRGYRDAQGREVIQTKEDLQRRDEMFERIFRELKVGEVRWMDKDVQGLRGF